MSLLNRPSDGMHSVLVVLFKLLLDQKSDRERVLKLCAPPTAVETKQVAQTLNTWIKLGLFDEPEGKAVSIHADVHKDERTLERLPHLARRLVLRAENNADLWAVQESRAADFTRAVCWLLAQDVYTAEFVGWPESLLRRQVPTEVADDEQADLKFITNNERWAPLKAWTTWFGFGWTASTPNGVLMIDPTNAVRDALSQVFGKQSTLNADDFVFALAEALPVLDGGEYRKQVEAKLLERTGADAWVPPPPGQLSTSLSRSLLRLIAAGILKPENRDDSDSSRRVLLSGRNQSMIGQFSHFTLVPKSVNH
jgi:hypothetical protein